MTININAEHIERLRQLVGDDERLAAAIDIPVAQLQDPKLKADAGNGEGAVLHRGYLEDWRAAEDDPATAILAPVEVVVMSNADASIDIYVGGADKDPYAPGASSIRVEREHDTTRFMIYDAQCDAPRVFGIAYGKPVVELPNDWQIMPDETPEAGL